MNKRETIKLEKTVISRKNKPISLWHLRDRFLWLVKYQFVSKMTLAIGLWLLGIIARGLLSSIDRPAVTSGDLPFLMRSWQGWLLLVIGFGALVLYCIMDMQAMIIMSRVVVDGEKKKLRRIFLEAFYSSKLLCKPRGILVILFVGIFLPMIETAIGINLLWAVRIPDFILSFIHTRFVYQLAYYAILIIMMGIVVIYMFAFHFMILRQLDIKTAMKEARRFFWGYRKGLIWYYSFFVFKTVLVFLVIVVVTVLLPLWGLSALSLSKAMSRWIMVWIVLLNAAVIGGSLALLSSFHTVKLTILFDYFLKQPIEKELNNHVLSKESVIGKEASKKIGIQKHRLCTKLCGLLLSTVMISGHFSWVMIQDFDENFPKDSQTDIIAHRAGGTLAAENSLEGIRAAIQRGGYAAEIDVQRTADGAYVLHHDESFARLGNDRRSSDQMTLKEIKALSLTNQFDPTAKPVKFATMEEVLEEAKGKIYLYIELKGKTADRRMAEDLYKMIESRDMLDQCSLISLDYSLISYVERTFPKVTTVYLLFYAYGELEHLECDGFGLEAEMATAENIDKIHAVGKRVDVWTCNTSASISRFLLSNADGIITDEVVWAGEIKRFLAGQDDLSRILRFFITE